MVCITLHSTHAHPHTPHLHADRKKGPVSRAKCPVLGKPSGLPCQWHPGERAGKHAAVSEAAGLFVIFSKVTRDCRRLTQWKILTEIMMEKEKKAKMYDSSRNPAVKS